MQIYFNDVGSGEPLLGQAGEEEFVDDTFPRDANPTLLFASWMGCYYHAAVHALWPYWHIRTVVEAAHQQAFGTMLELIGWQVQTCLDQRMIQHRVVTAAHHE